MSKKVQHLQSSIVVFHLFVSIILLPNSRGKIPMYDSTQIKVIGKASSSSHRNRNRNWTEHTSNQWAMDCVPRILRHSVASVICHYNSFLHCLWMLHAFCVCAKIKSNHTMRYHGLKAHSLRPCRKKRTFGEKPCTLHVTALNEQKKIATPDQNSAGNCCDCYFKDRDIAVAAYDSCI